MKIADFVHRDCSTRTQSEGIYPCKPRSAQCAVLRSRMAAFRPKSAVNKSPSAATQCAKEAKEHPAEYAHASK